MKVSGLYPLISLSQMHDFPNPLERRQCRLESISRWVVKIQISVHVQTGYGHLNMTLTQDIPHINFKIHKDFSQSFQKMLEY